MVKKRETKKDTVCKESCAGTSSRNTWFIGISLIAVVTVFVIAMGRTGTQIPASGGQ